jgi:chromosome segregation ATPase
MSFSLKPKQPGSQPPAASTRGEANWIAIILAVAVFAIAGTAFSLYSTKSALEARVNSLESQLQQNVAEIRKNAENLSSDIQVVTKKVGVTAQELDASRKYAEQLRQRQEKADADLANELATKASSTDVAANVAAVREEATTKVAEVQKDADTKIGSVSGEVKTVATNLEATRQDLAASRREITDVKTTLSQQIAKNADELSALRLKGERDFFEFDIKKGKKDVMQRVADIQLELRDTDVKKKKYGVIIQVDDSRLEKKDRTANEPVQFLVGRDKLRYELVVNFVDKDRIRGYLSAPKDKVLSAERPAFRTQ